MVFVAYEAIKEAFLAAIVLFKMLLCDNNGAVAQSKEPRYH